MKKILNLYLTILIVFSFLYANTVNATHITGGDITYKIIGSTATDITYRFTLTIYRDCSGIYSSPGNFTVKSTSLNFDTYFNPVGISEDVTPICLPPDVLNKPWIRCDTLSPSVITGIKKDVYERVLVLPKNSGSYVVSWSSCCMNRFTTISNSVSSSLYLQCVFSTDSNLVNNSNTFSGPGYVYTPKFSRYNYNPICQNTSDSTFININGNKVIKDSLVYELIPAWSAASTNFSDQLLGNNINMTLVPGLNGTNFLHTTSGVSINSKTGTISFLPTVVETAIVQIKVTHWKAIPNSSGSGYTRVNTGHIVKSMRVDIGEATNNVIAFGGFSSDSSNFNTIVDSNTVSTCLIQNNKITFKIKASDSSNIRIKQLNLLDSNYFSNFSMKVSHNFNGITDTMTVTVNFDRINGNYQKTLLFEAYSCLNDGRKMSTFIPINVEFVKGDVKFSQDTIYKCIGSSSIKLELPNAKGVKWTPNSFIVNAQPIDSSWVEVNPPSSMWYYASNNNNSGCIVNDSIFVKLDTCGQIVGKLFLDQNKNCVLDANEALLSNKNLTFKGVSSSFTSTISTDNAGNYSISPPSNSSYSVKSTNLFFNCGTAVNEFLINNATSTLNQDIPVKDSALLLSFNQLIKKDYCVSIPVKFNFAIQKSIGTLYSILYLGNGDSIKSNWSISDSSANIMYSYTYHNSGTFYPTIVWKNADNQTVFTKILDTIKMNSCFEGTIFSDNDTNCVFTSKDDTLGNYKVKVKNLTTGLDTIYFTNNSGQFKFIKNINTSYEISLYNTLSCSAGSSIYIIPSFTTDTFLVKNLGVNPHYYNYILSLTRTGQINNTNYFKLSLKSNNITQKDSTLKFRRYRVTLPNKVKSVTVTGYNVSYTQVGNNLDIISTSGFFPLVTLSFDSLVFNDTLKFGIRLIRVLQEADTSDNYTLLVIRAFTSYDPNNKISMMPSLDLSQNFTDKSNTILYTINFQNTGNATAKNIYLTDKLDSKLDLSTLTILNYSHSMETQLNDNNVLKFKFDNINLPDSNANEPASHGFVSFSIKPKPSIIFGDIIKNQAQIFFDFNPPIATNMTENKYVQKAASGPSNPTNPASIAGASSKESWAIYPNPATDLLNLTYPANQKGTLEIRDLTNKLIYSGQLIKSLSIKDLSSGVYILLIKSDQEIREFKLIKQ